jgi:hypothetical protein
MKRGTKHDPATIDAISVGITRRHQYKQAAAVARALLYSKDADPELARLAVGEALAHAPESMRPVWERYAAALTAGRRFKIGTYPATVIIPPDAELTAEVDAIFETDDPE